VCCLCLYLLTRPSTHPKDLNYHVKYLVSKCSYSLEESGVRTSSSEFQGKGTYSSAPNRKEVWGPVAKESC
jgi:hypothetical protein